MRVFKKLIKLARVVEEKRSGTIFTTHSRPLHSQNYGLQSDVQITPTSLAIVMQGQLILKNKFTLETILIYKKTFPPNTVLIVSTWKGSDEKTVKLLRESGVVVLLHDKPKIGGIGNINFQIISTRAGIREAKKHNVQYILKTRTDIRMYSTNIAEYLVSMCNMFIVPQNYTQEKRIVAFSVNTYKYRPYSISDLTLFGTTHDIEEYFTVDEDNRTTPHFDTIESWSKERFCEVYLSTHFLEKVGRKLTFTMEDSWKAYAEHFCVVDANSVDLIWYKYDYKEEYRDLGYSCMKNNQELTFREWVILYSSLHNKKNYLVRRWWIYLK